MSDRIVTGKSDSLKKAAENPQFPPPPRAIPLEFPGLVLISLYLFALAVVIVIGVVSGPHYPPLFLLFAACFITASGGLLMLFRWAWSLALAAVLLLVIYNSWVFWRMHAGAALLQGIFNLIFFLYLVRPEIRERLR